MKPFDRRKSRYLKRVTREWQRRGHNSPDKGSIMAWEPTASREEIQKLREELRKLAAREPVYDYDVIRASEGVIGAWGTGTGGEAMDRAMELMCTPRSQVPDMAREFSAHLARLVESQLKELFWEADRGLERLVQERRLVPFPGETRMVGNRA